MQHDVGLDEQVEVVRHRTEVRRRCRTTLLVTLRHQFERHLTDGCRNLTIFAYEVFKRAIAQVEDGLFGSCAVELQQRVLAVEVKSQLRLDVVNRQIFHHILRMFLLLSKKWWFLVYRAKFRSVRNKKGVTAVTPMLNKKLNYYNYKN